MTATTLPAAPSFGACVARLRRRRGLSQEVCAGLVGRTADWLSKVENDRISIDRVSVLRQLASVLRVDLAVLVEAVDR
jgi:transcriptional regulator with XRE-family HTH domain